MPTIVQINSFDVGSTGTIATQINLTAEKYGYKTYFFFGRFWRKKHPLVDNHIKIGNSFDCFFHLLLGRFFDAVGLGSVWSTKRMIKDLEKLSPDIIHLHNIHGYYMNYPIFFRYLKRKNIPVVWTLHDCWSFTGHCSHFDFTGCQKWIEQCYKCPLKSDYPKSVWFDRSRKNYLLKKKYFTSLGDNLKIVTVSSWLRNLLKESFFYDSKAHLIHNGIDIETFKPTLDTNLIERFHLQNKKVLLGVAAPWTERKGLFDFYKLRELLSENYAIVLVGLSARQLKDLPGGVIGLGRTESVKELVEFYSIADMFINLTYEDNYPTVNLEAIACGTPVITFNTGGSSESVSEKTGFVVDKGDIANVIKAIYKISKGDRIQYRNDCRKFAEHNFDKRLCFEKYVELYNQIIAR